MAGFSLEDLDTHIENLRTQLQFLKEGLDATDHNAPDWLATDLISLRNKSGRLQDEMKRFRDQLQSEGLVVKKACAKTANKRLSIEGAKPKKPSTPTPQTIDPPNQAVSPPVDQSPTPRAKHTPLQNSYAGGHVDVTEEVNRRLQESRLRRLMETPSTAHKRKRDALGESPADGEGDTWSSRSGYSGSEYDGTPTKRLKSSGAFEQLLKRKEDGSVQEGADQRFPDRTDTKRRRC
ncbi:hypothetical protein GQ44DRAFT_773320 [Phaeosphaeriaceae sp. PMI808]|nr:hypothetical protein GQ44DRAFT_773320 [Phaeosphaeriaceae sp. PMI808]